jgi:hypothetical protein
MRIKIWQEHLYDIKEFGGGGQGSAICSVHNSPKCDRKVGNRKGVKRNKHKNGVTIFCHSFVYLFLFVLDSVKDSYMHFTLTLQQQQQLEIAVTSLCSDPLLAARHLLRCVCLLKQTETTICTVSIKLF